MVSQLDWPPEMVEHFSRMISTDNPKHDRLRPIVSTAFNRRTIKTVEDSIERVADEVTSRALSHGSRYFINDVATPFPLEIISTMMNVPPSEYGTVLHSSNVILSMGEASAALTAIMKELGQYRVTHPIDDITSTLVNATIEFATLTQQELASFFNLLVTAGIETTRTAIDHGLHALSEHPGQKARMVADFEGLAATATDAITR